MATSPFLDMTSGYFERSRDSMPLQGDRAPWRLQQHYGKDSVLYLGPINDEGLEFRRGGNRAGSSLNTSAEAARRCQQRSGCHCAARAVAGPGYVDTVAGMSRGPRQAKQECPGADQQSAGASASHVHELMGTLVRHTEHRPDVAKRDVRRGQFVSQARGSGEGFTFQLARGFPLLANLPCTSLSIMHGAEIQPYGYLHSGQGYVEGDRDELPGIQFDIGKSACLGQFPELGHVDGPPVSLAGHLYPVDDVVHFLTLICA